MYYWGCICHVLLLSLVTLLRLRGTWIHKNLQVLTETDRLEEKQLLLVYLNLCWYEFCWVFMRGISLYPHYRGRITSNLILYLIWMRFLWTLHSCQSHRRLWVWCHFLLNLLKRKLVIDQDATTLRLMIGNKLNID